MYCRFFVVANGMASFHNLVMIMVELCGQKLDYKGLRLAMVAILDMVTFSQLFSLPRDKKGREDSLLNKNYFAQMFADDGGSGIRRG